MRLSYRSPKIESEYRAQKKQKKKQKVFRTFSNAQKKIPQRILFSHYYKYLELINISFLLKDNLKRDFEEE